jgi:hypothetical protein
LRSRAVLGAAEYESELSSSRVGKGRGGESAAALLKIRKLALDSTPQYDARKGKDGRSGCNPAWW